MGRPSYAFAILCVCLTLSFSSVGFAEDKDRPAELRLALKLPQAVLVKGEHGTAVLHGEISPDGSIQNLTITDSTQSETLNAYAVEKLTGVVLSKIGVKFAKDYRTINITADMYGFNLNNLYTDYFCEQAVRDMNWRHSEFPDAPYKGHPMYDYLTGQALISGRADLAFAKDRARYIAAWREATAACKVDGKSRFLTKLIAAGAK